MFAERKRTTEGETEELKRMTSCEKGASTRQKRKRDGEETAKDHDGKGAALRRSLVFAKPALHGSGSRCNQHLESICGPSYPGSREAKPGRRHRRSAEVDFRRYGGSLVAINYTLGIKVI